MYKDINTLLTEKKTEEERRTELFSLLPDLKEGNKIYYNKDSYIFMEKENLYNGMDKYPKNSLIKGCFPYICLLSAIYNALYFAEEAKKYEAFLNDKKYKETTQGFIYHPEIGIIAENNTIKNLLAEFKEKENIEEVLVEDALNKAIENSKKDEDNKKESL